MRNPFKVEKRLRIAQMTIAPWKRLAEPKRGKGEFGSTE
ncbi:hypothetical protein B4100_2790 [Heyndrickxia coagulans]|nr:hypothetical protein B4100_2790 [Heyndrickxia coagulans]